MKRTCLVAALLAAGCGGVPSYKTSLPKNLEVATRLEGAQAALDVHRVNAGCETEHLGRVNLGTAPAQIGIPEGRLYLDFIFMTGGLFTGTGTTRYGTLLTPRAGYEYRALASYEKGIYGVEIRELRKGSKQGRVIDTAPLRNCKAG
jgi:hypothetical protein